MPERSERHFAGKVHAFNAGYAKVSNLDYEVIGSLDADVSFEPGHFEFLVSRFVQDPSLGVVGAPFREGTFSTTTAFQILRMCGVAANSSARNALKISADISPLKVAASTMSPSFRQE